jgi:hypothetical protein
LNLNVMKIKSRLYILTRYRESGNDTEFSIDHHFRWEQVLDVWFSVESGRSSELSGFSGHKRPDRREMYA